MDEMELVYQRLTRLEDGSTKLADAVSKLSTVLDYQTRVLSKLDSHLSGEPGSPGIITRLDRIEQTEGRRKWTVRVLGGVILADLVHFFVTTFQGKH